MGYTGKGRGSRGTRPFLLIALGSTTIIHTLTNKMKFTDVDDYQKFALTTAIYPDRGNNIVYPVLGLMGESGEVAEKVKKVIRDKGGKLTDEDKVNIALELSDTLWYTATIASELGFNLSEIFQKNIDKLSSRKERGVLSGSGDNR